MERWALGISNEFLLHPASQPNIIMPWRLSWSTARWLLQHDDY